LYFQASNAGAGIRRLGFAAWVAARRSALGPDRAAFMCSGSLPVCGTGALSVNAWLTPKAKSVFHGT
jgi:hypothetical protein